MSIRWSDDDLKKFKERRGKSALPSISPKISADFKHRALGRLPVGHMNKTEAAYDAHLRQLFHAGDVLWHKFEGVKLRLADNTFYTCDFAVLPATGVLEMHEVKGFWQDDARVKIKVAASLYPFRFVAVKARAKKNGGGWELEEF